MSTMPKSQNGYSANDVGVTETVAVRGTRVKLRVRKGVTGRILAEVAALWDDRVEDIDTAGAFTTDPAPACPGAGPSKVADDWSFAERPIRGSAEELSNHASGTAIDLNATQHPLGVKGTYTAAQLTAMHGIAREFVDPRTGRSVLRLGEDYTKRKDGMHIEIDADEAACARAWAAYVARHAPKPAPATGPAKPAPAPAPATRPGLLGGLLGRLVRRPAAAPAAGVVSLPAVIRAAKTGGNGGESVKTLQRALAVPADGVFGPKTRAAYASWQRSLGYKGTDADGIPGATSLAKLAARKAFRVSPT